MLSALWYAFRVVVFLALLILFPLGTGLAFWNRNQHGIGYTITYGVCVCFALFEIIYIPFLFTTRALSHVTFAYLPVLFILSAYGFFRFSRSGLKLLPKIVLSKRERNLLIILISLIALQALRMVICVTNMVGDDSAYLAESISAIQNNSFFIHSAETGAAVSTYTNFQYSLAPWPIFLAVFSYAFGIHPAILTRTIMPAPLTVLFYIVLYLIFKYLFGGSREKTFIALIISVFYNYLLSSELAVKYFWMSFLPWYGKAVSPSILCPAAFLFYLRAVEARENAKTWWFGVFFAAVAICMVSTSGSVIYCLFMACCGVVYIIKNRDISLLWKLSLVSLPCIVQLAACFLL